MLTRHYLQTHILLSDAQVARLGIPSAFRTWEVTHDQVPEAPRLFLSIDSAFPASLPRLFLPDRERWFLKIPHVNKNGSICVRPPGATLNQIDCGEHVRILMEDAIDLVRTGLAGTNRADFISEIESYWSQTADGHEIVALIDIGARTRWVKAVHLREQRRFVIGDTEDDLKEWLSHFAGGRFRHALIFDTPYVWSDEPLYPEQYPKTAADIIRVVADAGLAQPADVALKAMASANGLPVILAFGSKETAAIGVSVPKMKAPAKGFHPHRISGDILLMFNGKLPCGRSAVHRATPQWIHWRGGAKNQFNALAARHVMIIGCGAVGADVAMLLAKAGVQKMTFVDPEILTWDNIGRHMAGAGWVGHYKVDAVAGSLTRHFSHLQITRVKKPIQELITNSMETFDAYDLLICATADWSGESILNAWIRRNRNVPVIFGWLEPHALAGQALLIAAEGGCLACGRDEAGQVNNPVIHWADEQTMKTPACGGSFTPYGAIDAGPVKEMIAQLAVDVLDGGLKTSTLRTFIGDPRRISSLGGTIQEPWPSFLSDPLILNRVVSQQWPSHERCPQCQ